MVSIYDIAGDFRIGYESHSQFSREFRRLFSASPRQHVTANRELSTIENQSIRWTTDLLRNDLLVKIHPESKSYSIVGASWCTPLANAGAFAATTFRSLACKLDRLLRLQNDVDELQ